MAQWSSRSDWNARAPVRVSGNVDPIGVAIHWPGGGSYRRDDHSDCLELVRAWQQMHMNAGNVNDIYYNLLACHHGYLIEGRSTQNRPRVRGGANGTRTSNYRWYSLQLMWGGGDGDPPDQLLATGRDGIDWLRSAGGAGTRLSGHRDHTSTTCPGEQLYMWAMQGAPDPIGDDIMANPDDYARAVHNLPVKIDQERHADLGYQHDQYRAASLWADASHRSRRAIVGIRWVADLMRELADDMNDDVRDAVNAGVAEILAAMELDDVEDDDGSGTSAA